MEWWCRQFLNALPSFLTHLKNNINFLFEMNKTENYVIIGSLDLFGKVGLGPEPIRENHNFCISLQNV